MSRGLVLRTARFELWQPRVGDVPGLVELIAAEETRRFLGPADPSARAQFEKLLKNAGCWALYGYGTFHVRRPGDDAIVASCGVFHSLRGFGQGMDDVAEAGWIVHRDHWGQGVAGEVMRAALAWFDAVHGPRRIAAMIEDGHAASLRVAASLGFVPYGRQDDEDATLILLERLPG